MLRGYRDLTAWQKAMDLVDAVYTLTGDWPRSEIYGLTSQIRRAIVSVPANIAEGQGRRGKKEFLHHLSIANGSLREVETHLLIALRRDWLGSDACERLLSATAEVGRLLNGLMRSLRVVPSSTDD